MKRLILLILLALSLPCFGATIKFYTDYPNSLPLSSDFLLFQRNNSYVNASQSQYLPLWFTSPAFTGTPTASGNFVVNGIYYGNGLGLTNVNASGTNSSFTYITNFTLYSTNILVQNITNNTFITTNVTVEFPGGLTNLNLTPNSVMYSDANDAEASIPNAVGVLTNNGVGGIGFSSTLFLTELDALNLFATNLFTFITNAQYLMADGNGKVVNGTGLPATNVLLSAGANINFTTNGDGTIVIAGSATNVINTVTNNTFVNTNLFISTSNAFFTNNTFINTNFSTNLYFVSGKGNTLIVTNITIATGGALTNQNITAKSAVITDANQVETNAVNAHGVFTNSAAGPPSFGLLQNTELVNSSITIQGSAVALGGTTLAAGSAPFFDLSSSTNLIYRYTTNAVTALALTFGKAYTTNLSANIVITAINAQDIAAYETGVLYCTNSSGTSWTVTLPGSFGGPGLGIPPVITVTNKQSARIYFDHYGNQESNAWFIARY